MTSKRHADTDLNHDNWDREDDNSGEENFGVFKKATDEELSKRKIKVARRRSDVVTTGGHEGPSVFKNFSGFGNIGSSGSQLPTFDFGAKKDTFGSASAGGGDKSISFDLNKSANSPPNKMMFEATAFKMPSSMAMPVNSSSSFSFSSASSCNKENSEPSSGQNKFGDASSASDSLTSVKTSSGRDASYDGNNTAYLASLKDLNQGVLDWIQKHLNKNININLIPVFDDYRKHFEELQKRYKPKFTKIEKSSDSSTSSKNEDVVPSKQSPSSSTTFNSSLATNKSGASLNQSPKASEASKLPTFTFKTTESVSPSFGSKDLKPQESSTKLPFLSGETPKLTFGAPDSQSKTSSSLSFGSDNSSKPKDNAGFSFGSSAQAFSFGAKESSKPAGGGFSFGSGASTFMASGFNSKPAFSSGGATEEAAGDEDAPPVPEVVEVKEDDAVYEKKCKLFYKKDGAYADKGVGTLFLKPVPDTEKTQLVVRAATNLGNVLLNILLNPKLPTQRMGKNNVLIVCVPNPPIDKIDANMPVSMLIRVKTGEDADELLEKINEYKGKDK